LEKELGWIPVESLETGLRKTIQWYLDNSHWVQRVKSGEYLNWMREHYGNDE
jgi:dTDP-glucose 4,6-dehydratase